ncbi:MAG: 50S ribosomal protein L15 [Dehalococcoidia bacterium]|nr:50S ribosomal protein L15 [Dehalococcoidia bacterium]
MEQHTLRQAQGAKRPKKRIGRGVGSGQGTYAGKGFKGQRKRGANKISPTFEGGQMPLMRRISHRPGFRNPFRVEFHAVSLGVLAERFPAGAVVDAQALAAVRLISGLLQPFKVLGNGPLAHALTVRAPRLSAAAKEAITAAGGSFEEFAPAVRQVRDRIHRRRAREAAAGDGGQPSGGGEG